MIGRRVVLRREAGRRDGRSLYRDLLGELVAVTPESVQVRRDDGGLVTVPAGQVRRLRPVPPSRAEVLALEEVAARGWPAPDTARLGQWLLRAGGGWTYRANSALLVGDPGLPLAEALGRVRDWYAARGLPGALTVPLPAMAAADRVAAGAGWLAEAEVDVLTAPLPAASPAAASPAAASPAAGQPTAGSRPGVRIDPEPPPSWRRMYRDGSVPPVGWQILTAAERVGFASVLAGGEVVALGRGVALAGWLGVTGVAVRPEHRRRGLARQLVTALLGWGAAQGATRCYLHVHPDNAAAMALYAGLGFSPHHRYRIRLAPAG